MQMLCNSTMTNGLGSNRCRFFKLSGCVLKVLLLYIIHFHRQIAQAHYMVCKVPVFSHLFYLGTSPLFFCVRLWKDIRIRIINSYNITVYGIVLCVFCCCYAYVIPTKLFYNIQKLLKNKKTVNPTSTVRPNHPPSSFSS